MCFWFSLDLMQKLLNLKWGSLASQLLRPGEMTLSLLFQRMENPQEIGLHWKKVVNTAWNSHSKSAITSYLALSTPTPFGKPVSRVSKPPMLELMLTFWMSFTRIFCSLQILFQWTAQNRCLEPLVLSQSLTYMRCPRRQPLRACLLEDRILQEQRLDQMVKFLFSASTILYGSFDIFLYVTSC